MLPPSSSREAVRNGRAELDNALLDFNTRLEMKFREERDDNKSVTVSKTKEGDNIRSQRLHSSVDSFGKSKPDKGLRIANEAVTAGNNAETGAARSPRLQSSFKSSGRIKPDLGSSKTNSWPESEARKHPQDTDVLAQADTFRDKEFLGKRILKRIRKMFRRS